MICRLISKLRTGNVGSSVVVSFVNLSGRGFVNWFVIKYCYFYDDDLITCWSSERYVFCLFDCSIDWQTIWQNMIMISTTEAELLTLTHASKQIMWWQQFFRQLDFDFSHEYMIHCDNEQTVDLINKTVPLISMKLCHIDIHQYWLHKHIQNKIFTVEKLSINQILADDLMKSLSCQKHEKFLQLLRMLNLSFHWIFWWFLHLKKTLFQTRIQLKKSSFLSSKVLSFYTLKRLYCIWKRLYFSCENTVFSYSF